MYVDVEYDHETDTYRTAHDFSADVPLGTTVILAVEEVTDGGDVLYDAVDPDALDDIFRPRSGAPSCRGGYVEFTISDHRVTVHSEGTIEITPSDSDV